MAKIVKKERLSADVVKMVLEAREIAEARKAGQFIVLRINEAGGANSPDHRGRRPKGGHRYHYLSGSRQIHETPRDDEPG